MSKICFLMMSFLFLMFIGCGEDKAPACSELVWGGSASIVEDQIDINLKYSAGEMCENYNDYYEADLNATIEKIRKIKITLDRECHIDGLPNGTCPDFVPETIEFGEMHECRFGTPPDKNTNCVASPLLIAFRNAGFFESYFWSFMVTSDPSIHKGKDNPIESAFSAVKDEIITYGYFKDESFSKATIVFEWTENEEKIRIELDAIVEGMTD